MRDEGGGMNEGIIARQGTKQGRVTETKTGTNLGRTLSHLTDAPVFLSPEETVRLLAAADRPAGMRRSTAVRAKVLLLLAEGTAGAAEIAALCDCSDGTVRNTHHLFHKEGVDGVLGWKPHIQVVNSAVEQAILALSREPAPQRLMTAPMGRPRKGAPQTRRPSPRTLSQWTTKLLAEEAMKRGIVKQISGITVSRILLKANKKPAINAEAVLAAEAAPPVPLEKWQIRRPLKPLTNAGRKKVRPIEQPPSLPGRKAMPSRYVVALPPEERDLLESLLAAADTPAWKKP
jgi:hypothetical protein